MRVVFIGSGELGCPALRAIKDAAEDELVMTVSQPDRPKGRRRQLAAVPLKQQAESLGLPIMTPENINAPKFLDQIKQLEPDIFVVASYGQFLGSELLNIPTLAAINIHPSLLPKYRGAAPIQWAIISGDQRTGVTMLFVDDRMDAGNIILQRDCLILADDTSASLKPRLAEMGAGMTVEVLDQFRAGTVGSIAQDESAVVMAPKFKKQDGKTDFNSPTCDLVNRVRGLYPWPCCFFEDRDGQRVRLIEVHAASGCGHPGVLLECDASGPLIATRDSALRLVKVQPPGKREMSGADYCNGRRLKLGERVAGD